MSYRIDVIRCAGDTVVTFTGLLDSVALVALLESLRRAGATRLVLATGTDATADSITALRRLTLPVDAQSAFLRQWLVGA